MPRRGARLNAVVRATLRAGCANAGAGAFRARLVHAIGAVFPRARRVARLRRLAVALLRARTAGPRATAAATHVRAGGTVQPSAVGVARLRDETAALLRSRSALAGACAAEAHLAGARRARTPLSGTGTRLHVVPRTAGRSRHANADAGAGNAGLNAATDGRAPVSAVVARLDAVVRALFGPGRAHARARTRDARLIRTGDPVLQCSGRVARLNDLPVARHGAGSARAGTRAAAANALTRRVALPNAAHIARLRREAVTPPRAWIASSRASAIDAQERTSVHWSGRNQVRAALDAVVDHTDDRSARFTDAIRHDRLTQALMWPRSRVAILSTGARPVGLPSTTRTNDLTLRGVAGARACPFRRAGLPDRADGAAVVRAARRPIRQHTTV